jgi:hypothetical protein
MGTAGGSISTRPSGKAMLYGEELAEIGDRQRSDDVAYAEFCGSVTFFKDLSVGPMGRARITPG